MKRLIRRISKVADSSQYSRLVRKGLATSKTVPAGHVPVYVGEEMERFVVSAELLNHPVFIKLLNKSAQEYGYDQKGVLHIPCHVLLFQRVLDSLRLGASSTYLLDLLHDCF